MKNPPNPFAILGKLSRAVAKPRRHPVRPAEPLTLLREYFTDYFRPRLRSNAFLIWAYLVSKCPNDMLLVPASFHDIRFHTGLTSNRALRQALDELERYGYLKSLDLPTAPGRPQTYSLSEHIGSTQFPLKQVTKMWLQANTRRRGKKKPEPEAHPGDTESTEKKGPPATDLGPQV
jgi:DNA-binding HxlR family transcriptional regulator